MNRAGLASLLIAAAALPLQACQTWEQRMTPAELLQSDCGAQDGLAWSYLPTPPPDSDAMRALAKASDPSAKPPFRAREAWFSLPTGETMLCVVGECSRWCWVSQWWQFARKQGQLQIERSDVSMVVTGAE